MSSFGQSYFPRSFFGGLDTGQDSGQPEIPVVSDSQIIGWIRSQAKATGGFTTIKIGRLAQALSNQDYPACWIYPVSFSELGDSDPERPTRTLKFAVDVAVLASVEPGDLDDLAQLEALSNALANRIEAGGPLGSIFALAALGEGVYGPIDQAGASHLVLAGSITYQIESRTARDIQADPWSHSG